MALVLRGLLGNHRSMSLGFGGTPVNWVLVSFLASFLIAVNTVVTKRTLMMHVPGVSGYMWFCGFIWVTIGILILFIMPWQVGTAGIAIAWAVLSGLSQAVGLLLVAAALRKLEASRVVAGYHTYPVLVAIMAVLFLGEHLSASHWIAIALVVAGGGLVMVGQKRVTAEAGNSAAIILVFLASAGIAVGMLTSKVALNGMDFWNAFALRSLFLGTVLLIPGLTPQGTRQVKLILGNRTAVLRIFVAEGMIAPVAIYFMIFALSLGPAALVTTLLATQPAFVLLISALLSTRHWNVMHEPLTREALGLKGASIAMVVGGAALLTLG